MSERTTQLRITVEPLDAYRCRFVLPRPVAPPGTLRRYLSAEEAGDSAVAQAVLGVPAVCEVELSGNTVTAVTHQPVSWDALVPAVRYGLETAVAAAATPAAPAPAPAAPPDDDTLFALVSDIFDQQINPAIAQHGGKVELLDVEQGVVVLRMLGGCQGCGMANVTLRQGIEGTLRRIVPGFRGLKDITDHASGTNPYFAAGTK